MTGPCVPLVFNFRDSRLQGDDSLYRSEKRGSRRLIPWFERDLTAQLLQSFDQAPDQSIRVEVVQEVGPQLDMTVCRFNT
jgi:hypothetical protein